jgi:TPR repeat protein
MKKSAWKEAFAKAEEPLGWYFAGKLSDDRREQFDFYQKSAEAGCSWAQVWYGTYFISHGQFVEKDMKVYVEWLEKSVERNNPLAMSLLGRWYRTDGGDNKKAVWYFRAAAELGWKRSMDSLADMLRGGDGCSKDLRQAVISGAKGDSGVFWDLLEDARGALESRATEDLDCDFDQLCYTFGWGLYWYQYGSEKWNDQIDKNQVFGIRCLDYYCSCVELQQESIFIFLLCWNQTTGGVKGPGQMIAQIVWEGREENLVVIEENDGKKPETKRIKK